MEPKEFKDSPLEMPISCKTVMEKVERAIQEEDEREKDAVRRTSGEKTKKK